MTIAAVTSEGSGVSLSDEDIDSLRTAFRGEIVVAGDGGYDVARSVWNGNIDRRPAVIAQCTGVADVQQAVNFARTHDIKLSVRGGGHSAPGYGTNDDGIVIDLTPMKGIRVDAEARTVRAEGGVIWSELDHETQAFGLATPGGTVSNTGIAGLTLGGGLGWLMGKHGLTVDSLLSADVVTADGQIRTASADSNPDLFWALRGGGGNFGVVTSFEYRVHPVTTVLGGLLLFPLAQAGEVLRFYRDFCPTLPDEAEMAAALLTSPDGIPVAALVPAYNGPIEEGERLFAPARSFLEPLADMVGPMPYVERQSLLDEPNAVHGLHRYWRSAFTQTITDELIEKLAAGAQTFSSPMDAMLFFYIHGAASRVPADATAFAARTPQWDFDIIGQWEGESESTEHIGWVRSVWDGLEEHLEGSAYVNHLADDDQPEKVRASFGTNYARLQALKAKYDPGNLFRINANIPPA